MNKNPVKIIKRLDAEAIAEVKTTARLSLVEGVTSGRKRKARPNINATIRSWITDREATTRVQHVAAVNYLFGNEVFSTAIVPTRRRSRRPKTKRRNLLPTPTRTG